MSLWRGRRLRAGGGDASVSCGVARGSAPSDGDGQTGRLPTRGLANQPTAQFRARSHV